jgi:hypothetical protein
MFSGVATVLLLLLGLNAFVLFSSTSCTWLILIILALFKTKKKGSETKQFVELAKVARSLNLEKGFD